MKKDKLEELIKINIDLSREKSLDMLLEKIVVLARDFTSADGGTLYIKDNDTKTLRFQVVQTGSLNINLGGATGTEINWPPLSLYKEDGSINNNNISVMSAITGHIINIHDVYQNHSEFNFEGVKKFDSGMNYLTKSILVTPLKDPDGNVIGVLQLINKHTDSSCVKESSVEFDKFDEELARALASQATISIINTRLINELEQFMIGFIESIGQAIDEKSPYTGGHVKQVGKLTQMIAEAVNRDSEFYPDKSFDEDELHTLQMAAWLHDVGKIAIPEHIMDKATKLEGITDKIELIKERVEILKRDIKIDMYEGNRSRFSYYMEVAKLTEDLAFLEKVNIGGEFLPDSDIDRIVEIAQREYTLQGEVVKLLRDDEVENLSIKRGTLLPKERDIIQSHAKMTLEILRRLPFPRKYSKIVDIASNHHEKIAGGGYPRNLSGDQISLEDRIVAVADIFEALTAHDRPYKKAKTLSEVFKIISFMVKDGEIDESLIRLFFRDKLYLQYAEDSMFPEQIDEPKLLF